MKRLLALPALLALSCAGPRLAPTNEGAPALEVLNWNLNYGLAGHEDALGLLRERDADLAIGRRPRPTGRTRCASRSASAIRT